MKLFTLTRTFLIGLTVLATSFAHADHHGMKNNNIVETASEAGAFSTLLAAAQAAGRPPGPIALRSARDQE